MPDHKCDGWCHPETMAIAMRGVMDNLAKTFAMLAPAIEWAVQKQKTADWLMGAYAVAMTGYQEKSRRARAWKASAKRWRARAHGAKRAVAQIDSLLQWFDGTRHG